MVRYRPVTDYFVLKIQEVAKSEPIWLKKVSNISFLAINPL